MIPTERIPTHPGEMLVEEFLKPLGITQVEFARHLGIPIQRVNEVVTGKRGVTPETAILFGAAFEISPQYWLNLQANYDLATTRAALPKIPRPITQRRRPPRGAERLPAKVAASAKSIKRK